MTEGPRQTARHSSPLPFLFIYFYLFLCFFVLTNFVCTKLNPQAPRCQILLTEGQRVMNALSADGVTDVD
jgi:hypothetical protein